jgi:hypothetical protein
LQAETHYPVSAFLVKACKQIKIPGEEQFTENFRSGIDIGQNFSQWTNGQNYL